MHKRHFIQSMRLPGLLDIARRSTICYTYYPGILLFPFSCCTVGNESTNCVLITIKGKQKIFQVYSRDFAILSDLIAV